MRQQIPLAFGVAILVTAFQAADAAGVRSDARLLPLIKKGAIVAGQGPNRNRPHALVHVLILNSKWQGEHADLQVLAEYAPVRYLSLISNDRVTDRTVEFVIKNLKLRTLRLIRLTKLTDGSLASIAASDSLKHLTLSRLNLTDPGLLQLKSMKRLERLRLSELDVSDATIKALREALPNCEITVLKKVPARQILASSAHYDPHDIAALVDSLEGLRCRPQRTVAGDALVDIGTPAVSPLVARLQSSSKWKQKLEIVYLLGRMGRRAKSAQPALREYMGKQRHPLTKGFAEAALAATRGDGNTLRQLAERSNKSVAAFADELRLLMRRPQGSVAAGESRSNK